MRRSAPQNPKRSTLGKARIRRLKALGSAPVGPEPAVLILRGTERAVEELARGVDGQAEMAVARALLDDEDRAGPEVTAAAPDVVVPPGATCASIRWARASPRRGATSRTPGPSPPPAGCRPTCLASSRQGRTAPGAGAGAIPGPAADSARAQPPPPRSPPLAGSPTASATCTAVHCQDPHRTDPRETRGPRPASTRSAWPSSPMSGENSAAGISKQQRTQ
jgi:hypothetical protein